MQQYFEMSINNIKEPRGLKLLKIKDEVNFYNFTDKFLSTLIFDILKSYLLETLFLLYAVQIIQGNTSIKVLTIDCFRS